MTRVQTPQSFNEVNCLTSHEASLTHTVIQNLPGG